MSRLCLAAFLSVTAAVVLAAPASGHGWTTAPPSRAALCADGVAQNCGEIQYEPQSVEGTKGFPGSGPADGRICSAGIDRFAALDQPRHGNWPATQVQSGQQVTFRWTLTAAHATTSFRYYITNGRYDATRPLTRSVLELTPIKSVSYGGAAPPAEVSHNVTLPSRQGKHLILGVWTIANTGNAFYQCSDIRFS